ncbi:hypothetical protein I3J13_20505 [Agrobacterium sp. MOPV5]|uniref:hypothetical protein n=1 Tax=Agrobacterium leguminum TaxID=2792015 RepID=UPI0018C21C21|nr:hypothetical protein [Agrobacterium leguminum]MBG0511162.1 hypothetical protein [Agrobacterium leguminum]
MPNSVSSFEQRRSSLRRAEIFVMFPFRTAVVLGALGFAYFALVLRPQENPLWLETAATVGAWILVLASIVRSVIALRTSPDGRYNRGASIATALIGTFISELPGLKHRYLEMRFSDPASSIRFRFPWRIKHSAVSPSLRFIEVLLLAVWATPSVLILLAFGLIVGNADLWGPALGQPAFAITIAFGWMIAILSAIAVLLAVIDAMFLLFAEGIKPDFANRAHRIGHWLKSLR